jgi:osmoprotectant transport system ATP-binding protein
MKGATVEPIIELKGVSKAFQSRLIVSHLDLSISSGKTTVLLGPSGSGKSTLLRMMIGLVLPDSGSIKVGGVPVNAASLIQLRRRIGYVIQEGGLFPHLTAFDNMALLARHLSWSSHQIKGRVRELVALTQFPEACLHSFPSQLSGGQRQRVSLIRALMLDPELLLLDEPMGALDPMIRSDLQKDLRRIFKSLQKTVVLVTHDLGEADYLGDEMVLMKEGKIVQEGALSELARAPKESFVSLFISSHRMPTLN